MGFGVGSVLLFRAPEAVRTALLQEQHSVRPQQGYLGTGARAFLCRMRRKAIQNRNPRPAKSHELPYIEQAAERTSAGCWHAIARRASRCTRCRSGCMPPRGGCLRGCPPSGARARGRVPPPTRPPTARSFGPPRLAPPTLALPALAAHTLLSSGSERAGVGGNGEEARVPAALPSSPSLCSSISSSASPV